MGPERDARARVLFFEGLVNLRLLTFIVVVVPWASPAFAQVIPGWETKQFTYEQIDADNLTLMRQVEVIGVGPNAGQQLFADELRWNIRTGEFTALGNVLMVSPTARLAAERVVFNTKTSRGTFYTASGIASLGDRATEHRSMFGTLEPDVYFGGEQIEKVGDDRYRITKGWFTTCVQPTPRWEIVSTTTTIDLEDYAILRNAIVRVKNVPVFYLPVLYYPIQSDDRSTGFLLPTYGRSTYRGQSISNAFFWAAGRSHDVTLFHDWLFSRGQGMGSEYRYLLGPGSEGKVRVYRLNERESTLETGSGSVTNPARRSFEIRGGMAHKLPAGFQARARVDYFSDVTVRQLYQNNFYDAANSNRQWGATLSGGWRGVTVNGGYERSEYFPSPSYYTASGSTPSISAALSSQQIGRLPLFASVNADLVRSLYQTVSDERVDDRTLWRRDLRPTLRASLSTLPFLLVNGSVNWRYTYYSQRLDAAGLQIPESVTRKFFDLRADVTGPVFTRVYTPNNAFAERLKHAIEPIFNLQRVTNIPEQRFIPIVGSAYDYIVGGVTRVTYGINNRLLVRRPAPAQPGAEPSTASAPREFLTVGLQQSYYSQAEASRYDPSYSLSYAQRDANKLSPVMLSVRAMPATAVSADLRMEYDTTTGTDKLQGVSINGTVTTTTVQSTVGWSQRRFPFNDVILPDSFIQSATTLKTSTGAAGGTYAFNYDIRRSNMMQQRWIGFYNAQCCGITFEYQEYNFPSGDPRFPIPKDRRFNMSFSLAGIGTFSNFFGSFGGGSRF
jgi:LPS-assembly protein